MNRKQTKNFNSLNVFLLSSLQEQFLEKSINNLMAADRQSLLNELKHVKDENQKLQDDLRKIQDEEKQFKRECKMFIKLNQLNIIYFYNSKSTIDGI